MQNPIKNLYVYVLNIPIVWNTIQHLLGSETFKYEMYPSVFKNRRGKLLDFGCSSGNATSVFLNFDYYGIDVDKEAIEFAKRKFGSHSNVHFQTADLTSGPFKESFFDHILFAGTAHHVTPEQLVVITKNLMVSLAFGGELHIFEPLRQAKDSFITKFILDNDQGKYIRTKEELFIFFEGAEYKISESKLFPSPNGLIKLPDFLYMRIEK